MLYSRLAFTVYYWLYFTNLNFEPSQYFVHLANNYTPDGFRDQLFFLLSYSRQGEYLQPPLSLTNILRFFFKNDQLTELLFKGNLSTIAVAFCPDQLI